MTKRKSQSTKGGMLEIKSQCNSEIDETSKTEDKSTLLPVSELMDLFDALEKTRKDTRVFAIRAIHEGLRFKVFAWEDKWSQPTTLLGDLKECIISDRLEESVLGVDCLALYAAQNLPPSHPTVMCSYREYLRSRISDVHEKRPFRAACATSLSWLLYHDRTEDYETVKDVMRYLAAIFTAFLPKGERILSHIGEEVVHLTCSFMHAWCLLYMVLPKEDVLRLGQTVEDDLVLLLQCKYVDIRLASAEALGVIYERIRSEENEFYQGCHYEELIECVGALALGYKKTHIKKEERMKSWPFWRLSYFLRLRKLPAAETVSIRKAEQLKMDSLQDIYIYSSIGRLLAGGLQVHLQGNDYLRQIFGLGSPKPMNPCQETGKRGNPDAGNERNRHYHWKTKLEQRNNPRRLKGFAYVEEEMEEGE